MLSRHRANDALPSEPGLDAKAQRRIARLQGDATQLRDWLTANPEDRQGAKGSIRKSNRTDKDSAKMATSKGVIQGYTGVVAVNDRHQIIIEAQAHGLNPFLDTGSEQALLLSGAEATTVHRTDQTLITADAGYHSADNLKQLAEMNVPAIIADNGVRQRDERFKDQGKYKQLPDPLYDKAHETVLPGTSHREAGASRLFALVRWNDGFGKDIRILYIARFCAGLSFYKACEK